ncbi:carboxypeptidase-like regulatory domain-containing protein [Adhaeribacter terreus]|uniref:Carboxypeptidase-like regulatory domain-containing protein n=1 Tax=Adhaeribacter terreus TaxID=529703 RepID=A0ABW0EA48_9BACT
MKKYWFGLICLFLLAGCKEVSEITDVKVTGQVIDITTKAPLNNVIVSLYEDNDGPFMGMHLLQTSTTDNSGKFSFNFSYKEGPYRVYVQRENYMYQRLEQDKIFNQQHIFDFQNIEALKNEQHMVFEMDPLAFLSLKLTKVVPAQPDDQIKLEVGKRLTNEAISTYNFTGLANIDLDIGSIPANRFIPIRIEVQENGNRRTVEDSVYLKAFERKTFNMDF